MSSEPLSPELADEVDTAVRNMVRDQIRRVVRLVEDVSGIGLPANTVRAVESGALTQWTWLGQHYIHLGGEPWEVEPLVTGAGKDDTVRWEFGPDGHLATSGGRD